MGAAPQSPQGPPVHTLGETEAGSGLPVSLVTKPHTNHLPSLNPSISACTAWRHGPPHTQTPGRDRQMDKGMKSTGLCGAAGGGQLVSGPSLPVPRASVYPSWARGLRSGSHGHGLPPTSEGSRTRPQEAGRAGIWGSEVDGYFSLFGKLPGRSSEDVQTDEGGWPTRFCPGQPGPQPLLSWTPGTQGAPGHPRRPLGPMARARGSTGAGRHSGRGAGALAVAPSRGSAQGRGTPGPPREPPPCT